MLDYLDAAIVNAVRQVLGGFGVIFVLAFLIWTMSQRRRGMGGGWLGNTYGSSGMTVGRFLPRSFI